MVCYGWIWYMIKFDIHRFGRIFCSPIPPSCRVGLLSPFHILHRCISLGRWLIFAFVSYVQPPALFKVENCESPSTASIVKRLCRLRTRENMESITRIVVLDPADGPVPHPPGHARTLLPYSSSYPSAEGNETLNSHDNPVHVQILSKLLSNRARIFPQRLYSPLHRFPLFRS